MVAASENLNPELFHGTTAWLKPGDIIKPGRRDDFYGPNAGYFNGGPRSGMTRPDDEHTSIGAYATPEKETGARFARQRMDFEEREAGLDYKLREEKQDGKSVWKRHYFVREGSAPHQPSLFAPVYPVEHVTEHSDPDNRLAEIGKTHRRDKVGFKVTGNPVAYGYWNDPVD